MPAEEWGGFEKALTSYQINDQLLAGMTQVWQNLSQIQIESAQAYLLSDRVNILRVLVNGNHSVHSGWFCQETVPKNVIEEYARRCMEFEEQVSAADGLTLEEHLLQELPEDLAFMDIGASLSQYLSQYLMRSKELKTKIYSHAHSLVLSQYLTHYP